jgi:cellulose synthase/poly-beta-1,6-N-acetylglucosamine synthase-like glycosyltransferase
LTHHRTVLEDLLATSVASVAAATLGLFVAGRWPSHFAVRLAPGLLVALALALGAPAGTILGLAAIAVLTVVLPRHWYAVGSWLFASVLVAFAAYTVYLARATILLGGDPVSTTLGIVLLALELGAMGLLLASAFEMVDALCAPSVEPALPPPPKTWPVVCIQVPTYNEPPGLVLETIASLVAIDHPALHIQVIDNNTTDEDLWRPVEEACVRRRADGHRVEFVHLPEWPGYKGGALNWGLRHLPADVEIIGVVDADYVVAPDWLRDTIPHFADPRVAFVQTPQDYRDWEGSSFFRACYVGFAYFFRVGMVSRARRDSIIFACTMGLIRRSVLDEIGGWDERIITEDAEVSLRVLARGYRPVYVPRPYGRGIMPLSYEGLRKQRFRWAFGGIQILRRHARTILGRRSGLTLGQRYDHLIGGLWWFNDALTLGFTIFAAAAALGAVSGHAFVVQRLTGIGLVLPIAFIGLNLVRYLWGLGIATRSGPAVALGALRVNLSLSWVIALACLRALTNEKGVFLRTPKFAGVAAIRELRVVWVEALIAGGAIVLLLFVLAEARAGSLALILGGLLGWALLIYGSAVGFALGDPTRAPLADVLRQKRLLELAPRVGRAARSRPARASAAVLVVLAALFGFAVASEGDRSAVATLPFQETPGGPGVGTGPTTAPTTGPSASPSEAPTSAATPGGTRSPVSTGGSLTGSPTASPVPGPFRTPAPTARPVATPTPTATPTARPTPPVVVPTPRSSDRPTAPPRPTPTPRHT